MRTVALCLAAWLILALLAAYPVGRVLANAACVPPTVTGLIASLPGVPNAVPLERPEPLVTALYAMKGDKFDYPYQDYIRFDWPGDTELEATFTMLPSKHWVEFWTSRIDPTHAWVFWYRPPNETIFTVHTTGGGSYYGKHPCAGFRVPIADARAVYALVWRG